MQPPAPTSFEAVHIVWTYVRQRDDFLAHWHKRMHQVTVQAFVTLKSEEVKRSIIEGILSDNCLPDEQTTAQLAAKQFFRDIRIIQETYEDTPPHDLHYNSDRLFVFMLQDLFDRGYASPCSMDKLAAAYMAQPVYKQMDIAYALMRSHMPAPKAGTFDTSKNTWKSFIEYALTQYKHAIIEPIA